MAGKSRMNGAVQLPPRWAEFVLERLLAGADSQTITGDLREEYAEAIVPAMGRLRAGCWYLRQVLSMAPQAISRQSSLRRVLVFVSLFTCAASGWLVLMEWLLHRPGYLLRAGIDCSITLVPLTTLLILLFHIGRRAELCLLAGAIALISVASEAVLRNARAPHFEGFVLLFSLLLTLQGILMLSSLGRRTGDLR